VAEGAAAAPCEQPPSHASSSQSGHSASTAVQAPATVVAALDGQRGAVHPVQAVIGRVDANHRLFSIQPSAQRHAAVSSAARSPAVCGANPAATSAVGKRRSASASATAGTCASNMLLRPQYGVTCSQHVAMANVLMVLLAVSVSVRRTCPAGCGGAADQDHRPLAQPTAQSAQPQGSDTAVK